MARNQMQTLLKWDCQDGYHTVSISQCASRYTSSVTEIGMT